MKLLQKIFARFKSLTPGSKKALFLGCKCPTFENNFGNGVLNGNFIDSPIDFWTSINCKIHGDKND